MNLKKIKWDMFLEDLDIWERTYRVFAGKLKDKFGLMSALFLKDHIEGGTSHFNSLYGLKEREHFEQTLENLKNFYDPNEDIRKLEKTLLCVTLEPLSYLVEEFGTGHICGKFLGMEDRQTFTKLKTESSGQYEQKESKMTLNLAYPTAFDSIRLTFLDIKNLEVFEE